MNSIVEELQSSTRASKPVHTPKSWHEMLHAGQKLSEATAKASNARFKINGKVKKGFELNTSDLAALEGARLDCSICKQTKAKATAAPRRKGQGKVAFTAEGKRYD